MLPLDFVGSFGWRAAVAQDAQVHCQTFVPFSSPVTGKSKEKKPWHFLDRGRGNAHDPPAISLPPWPRRVVGCARGEKVCSPTFNDRSTLKQFHDRIYTKEEGEGGGGGGR